MAEDRSQTSEISDQKKITRGWGWPALSRTAHYFDADGRSLCGAWAYFGPLEEGNDGSPDNCKTCQKKLHPPPKPLNTTQLAALRHADVSGVIRCDGSTAKALIARDYAGEIGKLLYITKAGAERAKKKADVVATPTSGAAPDPSLLEDLP